MPATISVDISLEENLVLSLSGSSELSLPASVTLPAGQLSTDFTFSASDDEIARGKRAVSISAISNELAVDLEESMIYFDNEPNTVLFDPGSRGSIIAGTASQEIAMGGTAVPVRLMPDEGWRFTGWDRNYHDVYGDLIITAAYASDDLVAERQLIDLPIGAVEGLPHSAGFDVSGDSAIKPMREPCMFLWMTVLTGRNRRYFGQVITAPMRMRQIAGSKEIPWLWEPAAIKTM